MINRFQVQWTLPINSVLTGDFECGILNGTVTLLKKHMITAEATSLQSFHQFVSRQLESPPRSRLSPEEALSLWRDEEAALAAIRDGVADVKAGRSKSLEEFDRVFRQRHGN